MDLDTLHKKLTALSYVLARSTLHHRLLPKNTTSIEGSRHVYMVSVKLRKAENDLHAKHIDSEFCLSSIRNLEYLASILGPN